MRGVNLVRQACGLIAAVILTGCATVSSEADTSVRILDAALGTPATELELRAQRGDSRAQAALSIVYEYGLHRMPRENSQAVVLRQQALAVHYTPIPQRGIYGASSRDDITRPDRILMPAELQFSRDCAAALDAGREDMFTTAGCEKVATYPVLKAQWDKALAG